MIDPDHQALAQLLESYYAEMEEAFRRNDIGGITRFFSPDYVSYERGGTRVARAETVAGLARMMETLRDVTWKREVRGLFVSGDRAIATVHGVFEATSVEADGARTPFAFDITAEDEWVRSGDAWLTKQARSLGRHEVAPTPPA
ncbi:MAG TPA: nuclear transport factor 2 family protein, partial [Polyangiaceae bacterium]|nr:nuclear transport factor 2 family protein [Polyangiaceae bacterium]